MVDPPAAARDPLPTSFDLGADRLRATGNGAAERDTEASEETAKGDGGEEAATEATAAAAAAAAALALNAAAAIALTGSAMAARLTECVPGDAPAAFVEMDARTVVPGVETVLGVEDTEEEDWARRRDEEEEEEEGAAEEDDDDEEEEDTAEASTGEDRG